jgi:hypothetical protein
LTEENKVSRVAYALEEIDGAAHGAAAADGVRRFMLMKNSSTRLLMVKITA